MISRGLFSNTHTSASASADSAHSRRFVYPLVLLLFIPFLAVTSCKKHSPVSFCEGVDKEGVGVQCGKKFSTGDLTAVIQVEERFETESLKVVISRKTSYKNEHVSTIRQKVESDKGKATVPLSFYIEGDYVVDVFGKDDKPLGSGGISVVDTY